MEANTTRRSALYGLGALLIGQVMPNSTAQNESTNDDQSMNQPQQQQQQTEQGDYIYAEENGTIHFPLESYELSFAEGEMLITPSPQSNATAEQSDGYGGLQKDQQQQNQSEAGDAGANGFGSDTGGGGGGGAEGFGTGNGNQNQNQNQGGNESGGGDGSGGFNWGR